MDARALILVVERDPHVRDLEAFFLEQAGYGVEFAEDGVSALALARDLKPHILITEILVPKLDGLAVCRRLKAEPDTAGSIEAAERGRIDVESVVGRGTAFIVRVPAG